MKIEFNKKAWGWTLIIIPAVSFLGELITCPPSRCSPILVWWVIGIITIIIGIILLWRANKSK